MVWTKVSGDRPPSDPKYELPSSPDFEPAETKEELEVFAKLPKDKDIEKEDEIIGPAFKMLVASTGGEDSVRIADVDPVEYKELRELLTKYDSKEEGGNGDGCNGGGRGGGRGCRRRWAAEALT